MKSIIRLFKAVPIKGNNKKILPSEREKILQRTIKSGFILSDEVIGDYSKNELEIIITTIEKEIGLSGKQINSSFHKSWQKVRDADIEQLAMEQIIHYFTTYGFEELGIYNEESVYIPNEELDIPNIDLDKLQLIIIHGYTQEKLKEKLLNLLTLNVALKEDTINDIVEIALFVCLTEEDIHKIKNKETKLIMYHYLNMIPENPTEFLRYIIYQSIEKIILIKSEEIIAAIKSKKNINIINLFNQYDKKFGLKKLAEIFYRFKPLFLAFRTNNQLKKIINKIRRMADIYHKPMPEDYLNSITNRIKIGDIVDESRLKNELSKVNTFRKIRLAYALKFRTQDTESILYRIRNGKGFATEFNFNNKGMAEVVLQTVIESIVEDISNNVGDKKIFIPKNIFYTLPSTEKQFTGMLPSGTFVKIPKDMVVGIHWNNTAGHRIDLDFSLLNAEGKFGWDAGYRSADKGVLFSGDMTDAQNPNGASELFYVSKQVNESFIVFVNYYNFSKEDNITVPINIFVAQDKITRMKQNYMVNPNKMVVTTNSSINKKQKVLGLLVTTNDECRFYFAETYLGLSVTSGNSIFAENTRKYLLDFYQNTISLNEILENAGAKLVEKEECDIDLSPENLEKDTILNLLK